MKKLLIISNNVISYTNNNGKTILSFINGVKDLEVAQLYLSGERPKVSGYSYFQISDKDIIKGLFCTKKRGREYNSVVSNKTNDDFSIKKAVGRNDCTLAIRDILWWKKWKSKQLLHWLDNFSPDAILFVAGDSLFAYTICEFIKLRYNSKLSVYVTDDYIMSRKNEKTLHFIRRQAIIKRLKHILRLTSTFFTISEPMRRAYKKVLGVDSSLLFNMVDDMYDESYKKKEPEIILTYAGSFYYKRAEILGEVARAVGEYNKDNRYSRAKLMLYSNEEPNETVKREIVIPGASEYGGSLTQEQLKERLNTSDFLVFVESFDQEQIEKVKYSFSTKVPEYMSIGKPIIAIGPQVVGSMNYLRDIALCINDRKKIKSEIERIIKNENICRLYSKKSRNKYLLKHSPKVLQEEFIRLVL